jgi:CheY-like chemotaxis protein
MNGKKILLVDDDESFVESNKDLLEAHGYTVLTAADGESGLARAIAERPDLMLLDVMMAHDTEGFEISRKIRETPELQDLRVLLVTGIRKDKDLAYSFEPDDTWLPVQQILEKPVPPEKLLKTIQAELER